MPSNNVGKDSVRIEKIDVILRLIFSVLMVIEIAKLIELSVVYLVKQNAALFICLIALIIAVRSFKERCLTYIFFLSFSNFLLIFKFSVVNQHFAFLTSLLAVFLLEGLLSKTSLKKEDLIRITAILLISQMCILYFFAALWKMNPDYFTGMQMLEHIRNFLIFPDSQNPAPVIYIGLSILGLGIELILSIQFMLRKALLEFVQTLGFLFHISIVIMIGEGLRNSFQLMLFAGATLTIYPLCDPRNWTGSKILVFWDDQCEFCGKSVKIFKRVDRDLNFNYVSNSKLEEFDNLPFGRELIQDTIIVFDPTSGRYWIKSKAILYILSNNYFFWFAKPLIRLPFVFNLTDKFYDRVAKQRTCHI